MPERTSRWFDEAASTLEEKRRAALRVPHLAPLEQFRAALEARVGATVPHFDPFDGGIGAACLILLETPGPRAGAIRFVSRDNPTATARNLARFCKAAGFDRQSTVLWNVVPWVIHAEGARNRAPRGPEITAGLAALPGFLDLLPALRVVVLAGRVAALAKGTVCAVKPGVHVLRMPHPSPVYVNTAPDIAPGIVSTLRAAADFVRQTNP